jgi:hypothetical protein
MTVLENWLKLKAQFDREDAAVIERIVKAYGQGYQHILPSIDMLAEYLEVQLQTPGALSVNKLRSTSVYKTLVDSIQDELDAYIGFLKIEVQSAAESALRSGLAGERFLTKQALADALGVDVKDLPNDIAKRASNDKLAFLSDYLRPDGELMNRITGLTSYTDDIAAGILAQVGIGLSPKQIATWITDTYGMGLTDSLRIARTTQLYSYRQANNAVQMENADVLQGVVWSATLDSRTCMSCVELHGKVFPVGTLCNDHHNGRCVMLPYVIGADNPIQQTGDEWFRQQSEATQRAMMGNARYEAWQAGKFDLDKLTGTYEDGVFGEMRREVPLKELIDD